MEADSDQLIGYLYDGILAPDGWHPALAALLALTNSEQTTLLIWDRVTDAILVGEACGVDPEQLRRYEQEFAQYDPNKINSDRIPLLDWYFDHRELGAELLRRDYFYQTFMRENGLGAVIYSPLLRESNVVAALSFQRATSRVDTSLEDTARIACYMPHVQRAMRMRWKYQALHLQAKLGQAVIDRIGVPVFVIDEKGKVLLSNSDGGKWLSANGKSFCQHSAMKQASGRQVFERLAETVCSAKRNAVPQGVRLDTIDRRMIGYLVGIPLPVQHPLAGHSGGRTGLVFIHESQPHSRTVSQIMTSLFGLTPAELKLVDSLAQGLTLAEIAEKGSVAKETMRSHLKAVFGKTGVSRQSELISLIHGLGRFRHADPP